MPSALGNLFDEELQEQIYYVHCAYCDTILLVSVPCSRLTEVVKVSCGHCTSLLSVNMNNMRSSFLPLHLFSSFKPAAQEPITEICFDQHDNAFDHAVEKCSEKSNPSAPVLVPFSSTDDDEEEEEQEVAQVINKPPGKGQRPPSAYNLFIREEIQRLKAIYPTITHKQAFSMAAKNWAHVPVSEATEEGESQEDQRDSTLSFRSA